MKKDIICQVCGHSVDDHGNDGCYHLEDGKDKEGNYIVVPCNCEQSHTDVYNQKGNQ